MQSLWGSLVGMWKMRQLLWVLTQREISSRYAGTVVGVAWMYIQPLCMLAAFYLVFDVVLGLRLGEGAPTQAMGAFLVAGALPWMALSDALSRGMNSLLDAANLLQKNALPPALFPTRAVIASAVIYAPLIALMVLVYGFTRGFHWQMWAMVPLIALQLLLCLLLGYVLAILAAAMRDTVQLVNFFLSLGIYITPILFPLSMVPAALRWVLWMNPATPLVLGYQSLLLQGTLPQWQVWVALVGWVLVVALVLRVLVLRSREQLVDWL